MGFPTCSGQDSVSPSVNLSHEEASISLYPSPSEGTQIEKHNHRKLIKLITWTTSLSNSVNMMYRARQSGQVMVESSEKTWYTGEGNANHFSILALRTL